MLGWDYYFLWGYAQSSPPACTADPLSGTISQMAGCEESLEQYVACLIQTQRSLYAFILAQLPRISEAEDVLQETNVVLWTKRNEFSTADNIRAMIFQVARYQILAHRKRRQWDKSGFDEAIIEQLASESVERIGILEDKRRAMASCLQKLRPEDRQMIAERYAHGLSGKQLADQLGRTVDSVFHSLHRIRVSLIECVKRALPALEKS
jgi:RNA polymerase sigma-70 factor, ECF subfamily